MPSASFWFPNCFPIEASGVPLETANFIPDLVASNPAHSDGLNNADAHLRLIKGTIKATFPNFTDVALASTQAQLDAATTAVNTNGVTLLASAVNFKTNTSDGFGNPAAGEVDVVSGGTVSARFQATAASVPGSFTAAGQGFIGPGSCPIGAVMIWPFNELPTGFGVWAWCNGQAVSRTTYATYAGQCATDSYPYGNGDGVTTVNVPNYQEITLVGRSTMGGAASPGLLTSIATGVKQLLGAVFGADTYKMAQSDLPNVAPTFTGTPGTATSTGLFVQNSGSEGVSGGANTPALTVTPGTTVVSNFTPAGTIASLNGNVTQTSQKICQPSMAVNFIIRIG